VTRGDAAFARGSLPGAPSSQGGGRGPIRRLGPTLGFSRATSGALVLSRRRPTWRLARLAELIGSDVEGVLHGGEAGHRPELPER
jgi:hypothetical protein